MSVRNRGLPVAPNKILKALGEKKGISITKHQDTNTKK
jgi:hypothetical protein